MNKSKPSNTSNIQASRYQSAYNDISEELNAFEQKYRMASRDCYKRFNAGELGDNADFFEWTGLYETFLLYRKRLETLEAQKQGCKN